VLQTPQQAAQDAPPGGGARGCVASLQNKWKELEAAAANASKELIKGWRL
jgi:hypothetical protein